MDYVVVFCDHAGEWHAVTGSSHWDCAYAAHAALVGTLCALDYYADCPPTVAKIIAGGNLDYAGAEPLTAPLIKTVY